MGAGSLRLVASLAVGAASVLAGSGCGGSTGPGGGDGGANDGTFFEVGADALPEVGADATGDAGSGSNPCDAGTCRFSSDPTGPCLPPGGPIAADDAGTLSGCCGCGSDGFCSAECVCASPDTPIATPAGDRLIAALAVGDLVYSVDHGRVVAVPVRETHRTPVSHHRVVELVLRDGGLLRISAGHPTADGRSFGELRAGDWLGGREIVSARAVPYEHDATYDILPDSDTGTYFADGALIGSTLAKTPRAAHPFTAACTLPPVQSP
jgi:hypothetical protein